MLIFLVILFLQLNTIKTNEHEHDHSDHTCHNMLVQNVINKINTSYVFLNIFDKNYADEAVELFKFIHNQNLPIVGICKDNECVAKFNSISKSQNCINSLCESNIITCPNYIFPEDKSIPNTTRCHGWRGIQTYKVFAILHVLLLGKHVILVDTDSINIIHYLYSDIKKINDDSIDTYLYFKDGLPWPEYWNFAIAIIRSTENNIRVFRKLSNLVFEVWDQAGWNILMYEEQIQGKFNCKIGNRNRFLTTNNRSLREGVSCEYDQFPEQKLCLCGLERSLDYKKIPNCY